MKEGKLESKSVKGNLKLESCMLSSVQGLDGGIRRFSGIFQLQLQHLHSLSLFGQLFPSRQ